MVRRHELTDEQWERLQPLLPPRKARTGRPVQNHRRILNGILWVIRTGELEGAAGKAAEAKFSEATRQLAGDTFVSAPSRLMHDLEAWLKAEAISYHQIPGKSAFALTLVGQRPDSVTLQAYATNLGKVVFQARSEWAIPEQLRSDVIKSAYMAFANWGLADCGSFHIEPATGQMVYRAAINWQGLEGDGISAATLEALSAALVAGSARLDDFRRVEFVLEEQSGPAGQAVRFMRPRSLKEIVTGVSATTLADMAGQRESYLMAADSFLCEFAGAFE